MIQFNNIDIYMKTIHEKEKKLDEVLDKLKNLEFSKHAKITDLEILEQQKNQLEIENSELQKKYEVLEEENKKLRNEFDDFKKKDKAEKIKEEEFSEKIDELNQETDILMKEIEKWQM